MELMITKWMKLDIWLVHYFVLKYRSLVVVNLLFVVLLLLLLPLFVADDNN